MLLGVNEQEVVAQLYANLSRGKKTNAIETRIAKVVLHKVFNMKKFHWES